MFLPKDIYERVLMRNAVYLGFMLLSLSVLSCAGGVKPEKYPQAVGGTLDLRSWDFDLQGSLPLDGEWEFFWHEFSTPGETDSENGNIPGNYAVVPGVWKNRLVDGVKLPGEGYATYRLHICIDPEDTGLALRIFTVGTAFEMYINGSLVGRSGVAGTDRFKSKPAFHTQVCPIDSGSAVDLDLILHVSNFHYRAGGPWRHIWIGKRGYLARRKWIMDMKSAFLFGTLIVLSFYHLAFFVMRRHDTQFLYLALLCLFISLRSVFTGEYLVTQIFPNIPFNLLIKIEYLASYLSLLAGNCLYRSLYPHEFPHWQPKVVLGIGGVLVLFVLVTPPRLFTYSIGPYYIFSLMVLASLMIINLIAVKRRRQGAVILLTGAVIVVVILVNDFLYSSFIINSVNLVDIGMTVFVFCHALLLSRRLTGAFSEVEELTDQLGKVNADLERQVENRTEELGKALEAIRSISEHDSLTGCFNRGYLEEKLPVEINRAMRYGRPLSIIMTDIDHFKRVNDTYGHQAGDEILKGIGRIFKETMRDDIDSVCRYGGEEFVIILPETTVTEASMVAERLRTIIEHSPIFIGTTALSVTASFGVTGFDHPGKKQKRVRIKMIEAVDKLLYQAKDEGRNRVISDVLQFTPDELDS